MTIDEVFNSVLTNENNLNLTTLTEEDYSVYTQQIDVSSVQNFLTSKPLTFAFRAKKSNIEAEMSLTLLISSE